MWIVGMVLALDSLHAWWHFLVRESYDCLINGVDSQFKN